MRLASTGINFNMYCTKHTQMRAIHKLAVRHMRLAKDTQSMFLLGRLRAFLANAHLQMTVHMTDSHKVQHVCVFGKGYFMFVYPKHTVCLNEDYEKELFAAISAGHFE